MANSNPEKLNEQNQPPTAKPAVDVAVGKDLVQLQALSMQGDPVQTSMVNVRLMVSETVFYDETLPVDVVRGILNPGVADFFVEVKSGPNIPRCKRHFLHTSFIQDLYLLDEL